MISFLDETRNGIRPGPAPERSLFDEKQAGRLSIPTDLFRRVSY